VNKSIAIIALSMLIMGCQQEQKSDTEQSESASTESVSAVADSAPAAKGELAEKDKMAYAIGTNLADSVSGINEEYKALGLDLSVVKQGFSDRLNKASKLDDKQIEQQFMIFQEKMRFEAQQKAQQDSAAKEAENKAYLAENLTKGFTATESGLQYKVLQAAKEGAATPTDADSVLVHYTGTFTDGTKFDSSLDRDTPFKFSLKGGVIQGWLEGVKLMAVGSKYQFVIPPELGYGAQNRGPIPGGSILLFDVELLEIVAAEKPEAEAK